MYIVRAIEFIYEDTYFSSGKNADVWGVFKEEYATGPNSNPYAWDACFRTKDSAKEWAWKLNDDIIEND